MLLILAVGALLAALGALYVAVTGHGMATPAAPRGAQERALWRMPDLKTLRRITLTPAQRLAMIGLRAYLLLAVLMVIVRVTQIAVSPSP
jgi:hypothetical protein